ncbi:hypothetical protein [Flavobacterium restrictum]|uniref:Lipoprotein n=1 Tax=Flavobacterium restrictum TaxID=2594428 RepID=A0A553E2E1_9FLAO|nr:hypothetical protein [Flavobacterium restrictum]TRX39211.1 hypothetical protein FNW21_09760 [Flavobacterium restrictum]
MKAIKKYKYIFLGLGIFFSGCQNEINEEIHSSTETISTTTPLTALVQRVVMQKTIYDDLIDESNYCTVKFPYEVSVNGASIALKSESDYQKVKNNIDANANDNDDVAIQFPVTMVFYNYLEKVIANQKEYDYLLAYWNAKADLLSKINCLTIQFPIVINSYDSNNQIANATTITDEKTFFAFINSLTAAQFIAIKYPITITNWKSQQVVVTTNTQLENLIKETLDSCPDNVITVLDFDQVLTTGSWKIAYFYEDKDKTSSYNNYVFTFKSDYTVSVTKGYYTYNGTWSTAIVDGVRTFETKFESEYLKEINIDWNVFEYNASQLRFRQEEDANESDYLYFIKN